MLSKKQYIMYESDSRTMRLVKKQFPEACKRHFKRSLDSGEVWIIDISPVQRHIIMNIRHPLIHNEDRSRLRIDSYAMAQCLKGTVEYLDDIEYEGKIDIPKDFADGNWKLQKITERVLKRKLNIK